MRASRRIRPPRVALRLLVTLAAWLIALVAHAATTHVVAPGHTLAKIAKRYNITVDALRVANQLRPGMQLRPGQRLIIPDGTAAPAPAPRPPASRSRQRETPQTTHLVATGHTLTRIAQRYNTSVGALREANGILAGARLRPGTCLVVPLPPDSDPVQPAARPCAVQPAASSAPATREAKPKNYAARSPRPGVVRLVRGSMSWSGRLTDRRGRPIPEARRHLDRILASDSNGEDHPTDLRLMSLLTQVSDHFGGRNIRVVSGYRPRSTNRFSAHSHHNQGEALDFYVEDVPNDVLRDFCHSLGKVGVGYYPHSSFIHLDVRNVTTHWVDESGPGEAPVYSSIVAPGSGRSPTARLRPRPAPPERPRNATDAPAVPPSATDDAPPLTSDPDTAPDTE